ncbi:MAG: sodium:solute symporter family protein, partial [Cytophagales bacterium]|nr:sodium:solute symporter family protein [Cytophagales bacterium]
MKINTITTTTALINYFTLDHIIVYLFLLATLLVGWYVGRNNKTIDDYAIGGRTFGLAVLVMTFLATQIGGATTIGFAGHVFSDGIIMLAAASGYFIARLFMALFIAPKMEYFDDCLTMGDIMGKLYGERSRLTTAIIGALFSIFFVAAQSLSLGIIFESLLGMKRNVGIALGGLTVVAYAAFGGIKSVAITDVVQFVVLIIMIPLIATVATNHEGGVNALFHKVPAEKWEVLGHEKFTDYLMLFLIWAMFPNEAAMPPVVQRMLMARDKKQIANMLKIGIVVNLGFDLMVVLIGFAALVSYPTISAHNALPQIVNKLLPIGLKGLAVAGLLAVVMSTADSYLNTAGLLLSHDIIKPLCDKRKVAVDELKVVKYVALIIGIAGMLL